MEHCAAAHHSFHLVHISLDSVWPLLRWHSSCTANGLETKALLGKKLCCQLSSSSQCPSHVRTVPQHRHGHDTEIQIRGILSAPFWLSTLLPSTVRACPFSLGRRFLLILPLPMDSSHILPNSRGLSANGLHILLNPGRRHYHFLDLLIR